MFAIVFTSTSRNDLARLQSDAVTEIRKAIAKYLSTTPHIPQAPRVKKLQHIRPPLYRLRVGDYRVYYRLMGQSVVILAVLNRRDVDRWLARNA